MPTRTYQVNYDIMANTQGAIQELNKLIQPMADVAAQARAAQEAFAQITEMSRAFKSNFSNFNIKPTIDLTSFKTSLASMEQNVKESAIRIRSAIESSLGGSRKAFEQNASLLGTNNWKKAEATETQMLKSRQQRLEALQKLYRKLSIENMRGKSKVKHLGELGELNKWFDTMASTKPIERVRSLLMENGIGNILSKNSAGKLIATDMSKLRDFTKLYRQQTEEFSAQQEKALKSNLSRTPNLLGQLGKRSGSFVSGLLGATPEEINNLKSAMSTIGGLMGGVQQTQEKVQNVVKKTPIVKPLKPKGLPTMKEMAKLGQEIESSAANGLAWSRDDEIRAWERLEKAGKLDNIANGRKTLEKLKAQRDIWVKSQAQTASTPELEAKKAQYGTYQKQWESFRKSVAAWRAKPYTETTEQVVTSVNNAKAATAQPIKLDIRGNFAKQIQPLIAVGKALNSIPKTPVEVPVNINITSGAVSALQAIKTNLQGINTARGKIAKGGFGKLEKIASSSKATIGNSSVRAALDRTTLGSDLKTSIQNLTRISKRDFVRVKAVLDRTTLAADLRNSINNLTRVASRYPVRLRAALDRTTLGSDLRKSIENLSRLVKEKPFSIKARFDATTLKEDLNKALSSLKTSGKNAPVIKVTLDTASAVEKLNALVSKIKSVSPQSIKLGATTSQAAVSNTARQPKEYVGSNSRAREISNIAASTAAMNRFTQANKPGIVDRLRKHMYPLTGNVSLGASTPVALDMAKGMGVMYGVGGAMNFVTGGLHDAMEYQNTMETAEEILKRNYSGKNFQKDFNDMTNEVRRVAKQTKFTAPQAADATRFMAMAGLSIPMIKSSVSPIADVAVIGDNDFGEVADKMTNIQTAFKIHPDKMRHVADAITNTFSKTNTDMMMIAESMQYAAPMAHLTGMSLEDVLAMVGIMGNSGIQASMAGTTLRMMMQNTLNPNKKQAALWKKLGVHTRDKNGNLRNLIDILADVKTAAKDKYPMADVVSTLFRVTASAGAGSLITNIDAVKKLAAQNKAVGNISTEVSAKKQNTVKGLWAQMTSAFTEANLKVFEQFQEDIKGMIKAVRDYFSSREAVENLRNAFNLIKDVVRIFGWFAKKWMSLYNTIPGIVKFVVAAQFAASQIGLLVKPILSLINVLGGLKGMTVGLVSALSGVGGLKKAAVAASVASAVVGGGSANANAANTVSNYISRRTALSPLTPSTQTAAYLSAYTPYAVASARMDKLKKDRMFYVMKGNRLKNSVQMSGSLAREAVNPFLFAGLSSFNPASKEDVKHLNEMMKNRNSMAKIYAAHPYQRGAMLRAYAKVGAIDSEMMSLQRDNLVRNKKLAQARTFRQLSDIGLLYRYHKMNPNADTEANRRYAEYRNMRRADQLANVALMSRFRYSGFYHPGRNAAIDTHFESRRRELAIASEARRAKQMQNMSLVYRAARIKGNVKSAVGAKWREGLANTISLSAMYKSTVGSVKNAVSGFVKSLKRGFISVVGTLAKFVGSLMGPAGILAAALAAAGVAAWGFYKEWKKIKEDRARNVANSNAIKKQADNFLNGYKQNVANVEKSVKLYNTNGNVLKNISESGRVLASHATNKTMTDFAKNFSAINSITDKMSDANKAKLIFSKYVEPNLELTGAGDDFYGKTIRGTFKENLERQIIQNNAHEIASAGGNIPAPHLHGDKVNLSWVKKQAAISQLYRAGASSKEAMDARKQIFEIYKNAKSIKEAQDKAKELVNTLFGSNSIQAIGEKDANYSSYGDIVNNKYLDQFKQYRWGAEQSLYNWINNPGNSKLAYFDGILKLKEKITPYTSEWQEAMSEIMSNMNLLFQDTNGKIHAVNLSFSKDGVPDWMKLHKELAKLHIDFGATFKNHLNVISDIVGQMYNIPELKSYINAIGGVREFLIRQIMNLNKIKELTSWNGDKFEKNLPKFSGTGRFAGKYSNEEYQKYRNEFIRTHGSMSVPLEKSEWIKQQKKKDAATKPFFANDGRKEASAIADAQIETNQKLKALNELSKSTKDIKNKVSNSGAGGSYNSPIADAAKDTNKGLGGGRYAGATARPTQINIKIDKLANFDKIQFLEGKDRDIAKAIADATAEAVSNLVPMLNGLVTNDKRADMI